MQVCLCSLVGLCADVCLHMACAFCVFVLSDICLAYRVSPNFLHTAAHSVASRWKETLGPSPTAAVSVEMGDENLRLYTARPCGCLRTKRLLSTRKRLCWRALRAQRKIPLSFSSSTPNCAEILQPVSSDSGKPQVCSLASCSCHLTCAWRTW